MLLKRLFPTVAVLLIACQVTQGQDVNNLQQTAPEETVTLEAQAVNPEWESNEYSRRFYELSVEMLGVEAETLDIAAYERRSYAIFGALAVSVGIDPVGWVDHLKNIPREVVMIVEDDLDPMILDSYENFLVALRGPI
jgi:hypothetical protein